LRAGRREPRNLESDPVREGERLRRSEARCVRFFLGGDGVIRMHMGVQHMVVVRASYPLYHNPIVATQVMASGPAPGSGRARESSTPRSPDRAQRICFNRINCMACASCFTDFDCLLRIHFVPSLLQRVYRLSGLSRPRRDVSSRALTLSDLCGLPESESASCAVCAQSRTHSFITLTPMASHGGARLGQSQSERGRIAMGKFCGLRDRDECLLR
jgi:hypothetical protein